MNTPPPEKKCPIIDAPCRGARCQWFVQAQHHGDGGIEDCVVFVMLDAIENKLMNHRYLDRPPVRDDNSPF